MTAPNIKNIKVIREYATWLLQAKGYSDATIDKMLRAVHLYEEYTENKDFSTFNKDKAIKFKKWLKNKENKGRSLAFNSYRTYLIHLKRFFEWLLTQSGYKSKINAANVEYLKINRRESRIAAQKHIRKFPLIDYITSLANSIEGKTDVELRDRALISFTFLTGMRDSAIISLPMKAVDISKMFVIQDPELGVRTKFGKTIYSKIFHFDPGLVKHFVDYYRHLSSKGFSANNPVFPRSKIVQGTNSMSFVESTQIEPVFWESTTSIREIFKKYAQKMNLDYYPPHAFRHSAMYYALKLSRNGDEVKAISQNFGHEEISTTISVYAQYEPEDLLVVLSNLDYKEKQVITNEDLYKLVMELKSKDSK